MLLKTLVAEATRTAKESTAKQVEAYGGPQYQLNSTVLLRLAQAIENGKLPLVPTIVVGGNNGQGSAGNLVEAMLAMMMGEKNAQMNAQKGAAGTSPLSPAVAPH